MSGNKYLADTNAYIYLLQKHPGLHSLLQGEWLYSFITEIELLGKPGIKPGEIILVKYAGDKHKSVAYRSNR